MAIETLFVVLTELFASPPNDTDSPPKETLCEASLKSFLLLPETVCYDEPLVESSTAEVVSDAFLAPI
jgi:hypothetical protein